MNTDITLGEDSQFQEQYGLIIWLDTLDKKEARKRARQIIKFLKELDDGK